MVLSGPSYRCFLVCVFSLSKPASREVRMLQVRMEVYSIEINILQVFDPRETIALDQWDCLVPSRSESDRCPTSGHLGFHAYVGCWTRVSDNSWQPTSWVIHWAWLILTNLGSWIWSTIEQRFYWLMTDYLIGFLWLQLHRITNNESSGLATADSGAPGLLGPPDMRVLAWNGWGERRSKTQFKSPWHTLVQSPILLCFTWKSTLT
jgi:hypothetical protein